MANAKKCDRCGAYFTPYNIHDKTIYMKMTNPVYITGKDASERKITGTLFPESNKYVDSDCDRTIDLCNLCARELFKFMAEKGADVHLPV